MRWARAAHLRSLVPRHRRSELRLIAHRSRQVVAVSGVVGVVVGIVVALLDLVVVDVVERHVLRLPLGWIAVLPGLGLLASGLIRRLGRVSAATTDEYLHAFHDQRHDLTLRALAVRLVASVATVGSGAPMGLEGPSLYAGATIGHRVQRRLPGPFRHTDPRLLMAAGAAAGVAAIFKAPATGVVFALEVPFHGAVAGGLLLPALVASSTAYLAFVAVHGTRSFFAMSVDPGFVVRDLVGALVLGVAAGITARLFAALIRRAKRVAASRHPFGAAAIAGAVLAGLFVLGRIVTGQSLVTGSGYDVVDWATDPNHSIPAILTVLALRCLATPAAVAGGGVGGLFIPLVACGALTGALVGQAVNRFDLELFVIIGIAAFLGAGYRVPLASVIFVAETTGRPSFIVPAFIAAVTADLLMGTSAVTAYQQPAPGSFAHTIDTLERSES